MMIFRSTLIAGLTASIALVGAQGVTLKKAESQPPTQEDLASPKATFSVVSANSALVKKALDCKDLKAGLKLVGKSGSFTGVVDTTYSPRGHKQIFLDFSNPWKTTISAKVMAKDFSKFPRLSTLKGKRVLISGKFDAYQGTHPEVSIESIDQIKLVK